MSEREPTPRDPCDLYAPTLAMLDAPNLDPGERRAALAHLAGCAHCQADQRAYSRLDADLRHTFGPGGAAPLRTADLLAVIGATHEPSTRVTMRSVVDLGHLDDTERMDRMHDTDRRDDVSAPSREVATPPTLRPGRQQWKAGLGAAAVALVVIVIAATLFSMRSHLSPVKTTGAAATQTTQGHAGGSVTAISMDSPTDGWAIGRPDASIVPPTPSGGSAGAAASSAIFYHFNGSAWVQAALVHGFDPTGAGDAFGVYIKMLSPTDGWAFDGGAHLLRYDGTAWRAATIGLSGSEQVVYVQTLTMISPTDGWAAARVNGGAAGTGTVSFLRYDGQRWTLDKSDLALPSAVDASLLTITGISETTGGDVWATSAPVPAGTAGVALVFHRVNGVWRVAATLRGAQTGTTISPTGIYMSSPTSGWIIGVAYQYTTSSEGTTTTGRALLLRYDGASWKPVSAPLAAVAEGASLQQIVAMGPNDIWVSGSAGHTEMASGLQLSSLLLRYDGQTWTSVTPNVAPTNGTTKTAIVTNISVSSDGALWMVGGTSVMSGNQTSAAPLFWRYRDGAWSAAPVTTGK